MLAQRVGAHRIEPLEARTQRFRSRVDPIEQGAGLLPQRLRILLSLLGLRPGFQMRLQFLLRGGQTRVDLRKLHVQLRQHVRGRFELPFLVSKPFDFGREHPPVNLPEVGVLLQPGQAFEPVPNPALLALHRGNPAANVAEFRFDATRLLLECVDLGCVGPAEHVAAPVVDAMSIVLLVSLSRGLDLAGGRDRTAFSPKLSLIGAAGEVESTSHLALEPSVERGVRLDDELANE